MAKLDYDCFTPNDTKRVGEDLDPSVAYRVVGEGDNRIYVPIFKRIDEEEDPNTKYVCGGKGNQILGTWHESDQYDSVNKPSHYASTKYETIDIIKDKLTEEQFYGFLCGNVLKYMTRWQKKNGVEDLKKAQWYLTRLIKEKEITDEE